LTGTATAEVRARRARRIGALLTVAFAALSAPPASADEAATAADQGLARLCGIVETAAGREGLPVNFFARLIWRESAFQTGAVSSAGAQGIAQFMPRTASERGLADAFDPAAAIPAAAQFLAVLAQRFGNLGLAAAAYNAGADALAEWLAGKSVLPLETQDYVRAVTGYGVEEWRGANPPYRAAPDADKPCLTSIQNLGIERGPEGGQIPARFSQSSPLRPFAGARRANYNAIGHMQLLRLAADANMTPRAYVQFALKDRGLDAKDNHSLDPREARPK
jgi:Transglycosylase SLT domain